MHCLQVVGVEGHNPSGHCLIASKLIDYVPLSVSENENLHPAKKPAMDQNLQLTDASCALQELSMVRSYFPIRELEEYKILPYIMLVL